jgi:hypothetical protein
MRELRFITLRPLALLLAPAAMGSPSHDASAGRVAP